MHSFFRCHPFVLCFFALAMVSWANAQSYLHHTVIFKVDEPQDPFALKRKIEPALKRENVKVLRLWQKFPKEITLNQKTGNSTKNHTLDHIYEFTYAGAASAVSVAQSMASLPYVIYAQPHYLPKLATTPNDEFLDRLEAYYQRIQLFDGWDVSKGDTNVVIGVVDTGTDTDHPDLVQNFAFNTADPVNGLDDDSDGFIDNYLGWDLAENDNDVQTKSSDHGVHMSGIIGATPNNGIGVAGVGYQCRILPIKIDEDSLGTLIAAYEGVKYAADQGCDIISCSWGGYFIGDFEREMIDYAVRVKNCLVIGAAGNDDRDDLFFPAAFDGVMAVASTDEEDRKVFNSNFNENIDISAPGERVYSTWGRGLYQSNTGTSVATAMVAGIAGLVKSYHSELSNEEIVELLKNTSDFIYNENSQYVGQLGRGRVNVWRALTGANTPEFIEESFVVYPNPIRKESMSYYNLYFYLEQDANVEIDLISMHGKKISLIENRFFPDGVYEYSMNALNYPSGLYIIRMKRDDREFFGRVLVQ